LQIKGGEIVGSGVKAITSGLDETIGKSTVFADESIQIAGIAIGRTEQIEGSAKHGLGLFLDFGRGFDG